MVGIATALAGVGVGVFRWMLKSHEDICAERYLAIEAISAQVGKLSDERHEENVQRFMGINRHLERQDDKLDRLLEKVAR